MDGQREGSMRRDRRTVQLPRSNSSQGPNTDDDSDNSRCPSPLLTVDGGYRIDPFFRYPISRVSRGVQFMTDYCEFIQIVRPGTQLNNPRYPDMGSTTSTVP